MKILNKTKLIFLTTKTGKKYSMEQKKHLFLKQ